MDPRFMPLPARLVDAAALAEALLSRRGQPLELQAGEVQQVGTAAIQVLLSAAATWRADGHSLRLTPPSAVLDDALATLGLHPDALTYEGPSP